MGQATYSRQSYLNKGGSNRREKEDCTVSDHEEPQNKADEADLTRQPSDLPEAAKRALAEAKARRAKAETGEKPPREINGRDGPDPARYGDWEKKGIAVDF